MKFFKSTIEISQIMLYNLVVLYKTRSTLGMINSDQRKGCPKRAKVQSFYV